MGVKMGNFIPKKEVVGSIKTLSSHGSFSQFVQQHPMVADPDVVDN